EFFDAVSQTLRTGRFMLLVVGDGIHHGLENLVDALHTHPQKLFTFGLIELQVFENPAVSNGRVIVPQIVAHSVEVVRAVESSWALIARCVRLAGGGCPTGSVGD